MELAAVIEARRAYKYLKSVPISDTIIEELLKAASLAPSCNNKQPWRYAFVKDEAKLEQLYEAYSRGNVWVENASMIIAVYTKEELDCIVKTRKYCLFDTGLSAAFLMLKATELGLVAHPIAGFKPKVVKRVLDIPADMQVIALIVVGKQDETQTEKPRPERLPFSEISTVI